jgi:hypothetical protein
MAKQLTESQKAASRANGRKSRGPVTEEGKRISSRNATKHGLLANSLMVDPESRPHFDALLNSLMATFDPQDAAERLHVESLASARWRLSRTWSVQSAAINHEIRHQSANLTDEDGPTQVMLAMRALDEKGNSLRTLSLYEHRYDLQQRQALQALDRLSQRRKKKNRAGNKGTWAFDDEFAENKESFPAQDPLPGDKRT